MQQNTKSIDSKTLAFIREHIKNNEKPVPYPYLDNKGKVTIGIGFLADSKAALQALPLITEGRLAKPEEIAKAWDTLAAEKKKGKDNFNKSHQHYKSMTAVTMPAADIDVRLDQEITARHDKAKGVIGADAWAKLTDGQKAAAVDIDYATGDIAKFEKFVAAAKKGDATAMARESVFHSGTNAQGTKQRNWDRVARNYCGAAGLGGKACDAAVRKHFEGTDETLPTILAVPPETPSTPKDPAATGKPGEPPAPPKVGREPEVLADAGAAKLIAADPAVENMKQALFMQGHPADEVMMKRPETWTEDEMHTVMKARMFLPSSDPNHARYADAERRHFAARYGSDPVQSDETGRPLTPQPKGVVPDRPEPVRTPDGGALDVALGRIGDHVAGLAKDDGLGRAVTGLQSGLNWLGAQGAETVDGKAPAARFAPLKQDGWIGPKTASAFADVFGAAGPAGFMKGLGQGFGFG